MSYSFEDREWVHEVLLRKIEESGLSIFIDSRTFRPSSPFPKEMLRGLRMSRKVLLVLSPEYLQSDSTELAVLPWEMLGPKIVLLRWKPCAIPRELQELHYIDFVDQKHSQEAWSELIQALSPPKAGSDVNDLMDSEVLQSVPVRREFLTHASVSDQPTTEDSVGFGPYVEAVARFLLNGDTVPPITLSIEGEWGCGKSSFMRQLQKVVENHLSSLDRRHEAVGTKVFTVWFNAWRHDKGEALWAAFALDFIDQISKSMDLGQRLSASWTLARGRYDWSAGWWDAVRSVAITMLWITLSGSALIFWLYGGFKVSDLLNNAGVNGLANFLISFGLKSSGIFGTVGALCYLVKSVNSVVGNPLRHELKKHLKCVDYTEKVAFVEKFHRDFTKIVRAYTSNSRVCVFVDDLDRCEVGTSADLLQSLNLMIAEENPLIFILGLDREKVAAGLAARSEKILPYLASQNIHGVQAHDPMIGIEYGLSFIEKFIQLPVRVPYPSKENLGQFLASLKGKQAQSVLPSHRITSESKSRVGATTFRNNLDLNTTGAQNESSETVPEAQEKRWEGFELQVAQGSDTIHNLIEMVAPALDYNPRRLKHFVNAFRLKAYLCFDTGLFNPLLDTANVSPVTFEQLGKFVALTLRWPLLLNDLYDDPARLPDLAKLAHPAAAPSGIDPLSRSPAFKYWCIQTRVMDLIKWDESDFPSRARKGGGSDRFDLRNFDVSALLRSSPRARRTLRPKAFEPSPGEFNDLIITNCDFANRKVSYRFIDGTESPDGQYALAWGFSLSDVNWDKLKQVDGTYHAAVEEMEEVRNYLVHIETHAILAETRGKHFGDKGKYNHTVCNVSWSQNAHIFVELNQTKWATRNASAYWILEDGRVIGPADLIYLANNAVQSAIEKEKVFEGFPFNRFAVSLTQANVTNEGHVNFYVGGEIPKGVSSPYFEAQMIARLVRTKTMALIAETVDFTLLPSVAA